MKLHDLLDRTLSQQEAAGVENHLQGCAPCLAQYKELQWVAQAIASLPYFSPSPEFGDKVLVALGIEEAADRLPIWERWVIGALGALVSCWTAGVLLLISSRLSIRGAIGAAELAANPSQLGVLLKLYLAKSALMLGDTLAAFRALDRVWPDMTYVPFRLVAASVVAAIFMAAVAQKTPNGVANGKWRTV
jgi:hypothetical protein